MREVEDIVKKNIFKTRRRESFRDKVKLEVEVRWISRHPEFRRMTALIWQQSCELWSRAAMTSASDLNTHDILAQTDF